MRITKSGFGSHFVVWCRTVPQSLNPTNQLIYKMTSFILYSSSFSSMVERCTYNARLNEIKTRKEHHIWRASNPYTYTGFCVIWICLVKCPAQMATAVWSFVLLFFCLHNYICALQVTSFTKLFGQNPRKLSLDTCLLLSSNNRYLLIWYLVTEAFA